MLKCATSNLQLFIGYTIVSYAWKTSKRLEVHADLKPAVQYSHTTRIAEVQKLARSATVSTLDQSNIVLDRLQDKSARDSRSRVSIRDTLCNAYWSL